MRRHESEQPDDAGRPDQAEFKGIEPPLRRLRRSHPREKSRDFLVVKRVVEPIDRHRGTRVPGDPERQSGQKLHDLAINEAVHEEQRDEAREPEAQGRDRPDVEPRGGMRSRWTHPEEDQPFRAEEGQARCEIPGDDDGRSGEEPLLPGGDPDRHQFRPISAEGDGQMLGPRVRRSKTRTDPGRCPHRRVGAMLFVRTGDCQPGIDPMWRFFHRSRPMSAEKWPKIFADRWPPGQFKPRKSVQADHKPRSPMPPPVVVTTIIAELGKQRGDRPRTTLR